MAGYIITLDNINSLELYIRNGVYATKLTAPNGYWKTHHEGTFADYATMQAGDSIYFFIKRKIYGIGQLVNVGHDCKYLNYPEATIPKAFSYNENKESLLWDESEFSINQRIICLFKPSPMFFKQGIDMDDVLSSNPAAFRMLRAFWRLSFLKFDDIEDQAFKDVILKFNKKHLDCSSEEAVFPSSYQEVHSDIKSRVSKGIYDFVPDNILEGCAKENALGHEMALEAGILYQITEDDIATRETFNNWDYIYHQVVASPFKPIDYMDKMDIFGYRYLPGYKPTKASYMVAEIKKDPAQKEDIDQLLKYVDWVNKEYCYGDYSMIEAYLVAYEFNQDVIRYCNDAAIRKYTIGMRPANSKEWKNLKLIKYWYDSGKKKIRFVLA